RKYMIVEAFNKHKKGYLVPLELSINLVSMGEREVAIVIARDLSHRNELEVKYKAIGEMARDAIIMVDSRSRVEYWNPAAEKIFGYTAKEIIGKEFFEYLAPERDRERVKKITERVLSSETGFKKYRIVEALGRRKNGEVFPLELSPSVFTINGKPHGLVIARDTSERRKIEEKIMRQNKELQLLYNFAQTITAELSLENIYRRSYEELRKIVNFDTYAIALYDEKEGKLKMALTLEDGRDITAKFKPFNLEESITGWVVKNKKSLLIRDFKKEKEKLPAKVHIVGWLPSSWLGVPLLYKNRVIGAVLVQTKKEDMLDENDKRLLETLAPQLAVAIMNAKLYTETKMTRDRLENLINTSIVGVGMTDLDDNLTFVNKKFAEMLGYEVNELIGKNIREITTGGGFQKIKKGTERRLRGISDSYETVFVRKDGKHIDVLINASPLKDEEGNIIGTIGIFIDITERKRVEERIREEREKYKTMMESLLVGVAILQDEKIVYANKVLGDMLGYSVNELTGEHFTRMVHPDMKEYVVENYRRRIRGGYVPESYIVKMVRKNGDTLWALTRAKIIEWEGRIADMVSVQDITRIKEMEDSLITLVRTFEEIKLAKSEDEIYDIAMRAISDTLNFSHLAIGKVIGDEIVLIKQRGFKSSNLIIKLNGKRGISAWVAKNNEPYYVPDVTKDPLYIEGVSGARCEYATPISTKDKVYGVLDVQREDVDSISEDERLLLDMLASHMGVALAGLEAMRDLEKARDLQELMVHIISHDLKNPLAVLSGYIDLLREMPSEEFLDAMEKAIKEAENIIERARLFSKLGKKKLEEKKEEIELRKLIEDVAAIILKKYKNVEFVNNVREITIFGDPILREVFVNLIDNAFKY
ncbi:MAG TPA: PAS domain S-box protein, partial [Candidatus Aciduliprofundum boonei]|nr:PAS domain S-box protein [Candidatus Aciduliprofundum boonei]